MTYITYFAISSARGDFYATEQLIEELEQSFPKSFYVFMGNICTGPNPFKVYRFIKKLIRNKQALLLKGDMEAKYCYDYESGNKDNLFHFFPDKKLSDNEQQLIYELFSSCPDYQTYAVDGAKFMLTTAIMPRTNFPSRYICNDKTGIYANNISMMAYSYIDASLSYLAIDTYPYVRAISLDSGWCHAVKRTEYEENTSKSMNIDFDSRDIIMRQRYGSIMPPKDNVGSRLVNFVATKNIYGKGEHYIFSPIRNNIEALKRIIDDISLQDEDPTYILMSGILGYKKSLDTLAFISTLYKYDYIIILGELEQNFIDEYKLNKNKLLKEVKGKYIWTEELFSEQDLDIIYQILSNGVTAHCLKSKDKVAETEFVISEKQDEDADISIFLGKDQFLLDMPEYNDYYINMNTDTLKFIRLSDTGITDYSDAYKVRRDFLLKYDTMDNFEDFEDYTSEEAFILLFNQNMNAYSKFKDKK